MDIYLASIFSDITSQQVLSEAVLDPDPDPDFSFRAGSSPGSGLGKLLRLLISWM